MAARDGRRTKIVATLGPASDSQATIGAMIEAGVDVVRLGLAHGTLDGHAGRVKRVREVAAARGSEVAVLVDLPGPKIRTGPFYAPATLEDGAAVRLHPGDGPSSAVAVFADYATLLDDVHPGDDVTLGDGAVVLRVVELENGAARCVVMHGGTVQGRPGVHLPAGRSRMYSPTEEDVELLRSPLARDADMVAVSFVRRGADLDTVRDVTGADGPLLIAKIETADAIRHLDDIVEAADAVMVARGDLGTECALEDVPHLQKRIVEACIARAKPVITATQMLESMTHTATPTRAEASDVANAVLDGTDALMLSGETAIGVDPANAVRTMARIAHRAEREVDAREWGRSVVELQHSTEIAWAMTHAAWRAALDARVAVILCCTRSGSTARRIATLRPPARIAGLSPFATTVRQLQVSWGVAPMYLPPYETTDEMVDNAVSAARAAGLVASGEVAAVLAGAPNGTAGTDVLRLVTVP